ncbi:MAG: aminotransferase class I/II-fold pyridoxal phosphate-dependent enzyme [Candidatus Helarchaeota archaeon]
MSQSVIKLNPLAEELNNIIQKNPALFSMLSELGKELYFPKGILAQSGEAKKKANKYNATIGIATENKIPMHLPCINHYFKNIGVSDIFGYAPASGKPELRQRWKEKILKDNPTLKGKTFSLPIITNAITHALSIAADMFVDEGDYIILPDKIWGNYRLIFQIRRKAEIIQYPTFNDQGGFNILGLKKLLELNKDKNKLIIILNFPNNPTGYSITKTEGAELINLFKKLTDNGQNLIVLCDDAYFGLFYEDEVLKESLFAQLANLSDNLLAIKADGATKEMFVWGFRTGFITFGCGNSDEVIYQALEKKVMGCIRGTISNCAHPSQSIILKALNSPSFEKEKNEKLEILKQRALRVKEVLKSDKYKAVWSVYPFNSGYFLCLQLKNVNAEKLRQHLLEKYGLGVIALGKTDIRVAFSCLELDNIKNVFDIIYTGISDLS